MNKKEIKKYIKHSIDEFPLSFIELDYKDKINSVFNKSGFKVTNSAKYFTNNFPIYRFYKKISRL